MGRYKTGEAISKLSADDKLMFICKESGLKMYVSKLGYIKVTEDNDEGSISGNITPFDEWELVKEPVDFMEAVTSGKKIKSEFWDTSEWVSKAFKEMSMMNDEDMTMCIEGKWYIMEDEE